MIEVSFRYMERQATRDISKDGLRSARSSDPSWSRAFELLRYELHRIAASEVVIEAGYKPSQVRADGWPYSSAVPEHHQVRVSFRAGGRSLSFFQGGFGGSTACVAYNVWLIGMTLQCLRAVDRYGCTQGGEQYRGWDQLPPGASEAAGGTGGGGGTSRNAPEWASIERARNWLASVAGCSGTDGDIYRAAARKAHPDAGGSNDLMAKVNRARDFIEKGAA